MPPLKWTPKGSLRALLLLTAAPLLVLVGIMIGALFVSIPEPLLRDPKASRYVRDRNGLLLARTRGEGNEWHRPLGRDELGDHFEKALLAAEDRRFYSHPGIDPVAMVRAFFDSIRHGRIVSGASTLTQQLARTSLGGVPRFWRKLREMSLALRLEAEYDKDELLELYVNHVHFGPQVLGLGAASERYFGKLPRELDLSEAATLAGLVRGPSLYDLERRPELARRRRDRVLDRLLRGGVYPRSAIERALATPLVLHARPPFAGAPHWVRSILERAPHGKTELRTTIDLTLQRELERIARAHVLRLRSFDASALAIVVLDNATSMVLAYVGSPDFFSIKADGQVDGAKAPRQPGSALKPFIYAAAIDELGMNAETELDDEPLSFAGRDGYWAPENYDRRFRGRVTLRRALANSLNVPAVFVLSRIGLERGLQSLHRFGFGSLTRPAEHYGPALALGAGEVTLVELASAYAALARGGSLLKARFLLDEELPEERAACTPHAAEEISRVLSDRAARREVFGSVNDFDFEFWAATKTGTSKGYRDAWALGYTEDITVAVWVGNFDGRPMRMGTGAGSAGPVFHETMARAVAHAGKVRRVPTDPLSPLPARALGALSPNDAAPLGASTTIRGPTLTFPKAGMRLVGQSHSGKVAEVRLRALRLGSHGSFWVDGERLRAATDGTLIWRPVPGKHEIFAEDSQGQTSPAIRVSVE